MMDADGQHDPADIARLLEHKDAYDMIVGARGKRSATVLHRDFANWFYNRLASYVTKFRVEDLTSGFRAVRAPVVREFVYLLPNTPFHTRPLLQWVICAVVEVLNMSPYGLQPGKGKVK